jgi:hypothetical protein
VNVRFASVAGALLPLLFAPAIPAGCRTPDYTEGQSNICEVHHVVMAKRAVPVAYGMIPMSRVEAEQGEWKRRMSFYPHPGDCDPATDINLFGETRRVVFVCPDCERAMRQRREKIP